MANRTAGSLWSGRSTTRVRCGRSPSRWSAQGDRWRMRSVRAGCSVDGVGHRRGGADPGRGGGRPTPGCRRRTATRPDQRGRDGGADPGDPGPRPDVVLVPGTTAGRDYAPRVAARLGVGLAADCVELAIEDGGLIAVRPILGGRVQTVVRMPGSRPQMATVHPGSFEKAMGEGSAPEAEPVPVELHEAELRVRVRETVQGGGGSADLESAEVVVGGGRGAQGAGQLRGRGGTGRDPRRRGWSHPGGHGCRLAATSRANRSNRTHRPRGCTSRWASAARCSTWLGSRDQDTSWRSTGTRTRQSSRLPPLGSLGPL